MEKEEEYQVDKEEEEDVEKSIKDERGREKGGNEYECHIKKEEEEEY